MRPLLQLLRVTEQPIAVRTIVFVTVVTAHFHPSVPASQLCAREQTAPDWFWGFIQLRASDRIRWK